MKNLSDTALVQELQSLVQRERELVTEVLKYLREVERRKIFLARGYSSLFVFCMGELGYSEPEAQLRIQTMRLMRQVPGVGAKIEKGELTMSVAAQIQSAARREGLEKQQTEELVDKLSGSSKREAEKKLAELFPEAAPREKVRDVADDLVEIRFTVSREQAEKFDQLMDLMAHTNFDRKYEKLFTQLVEKELNRKMKENPPQDAQPQRPDKVRSRYIPSAIRREVQARDQGCCQYQDPVTKKFCHSKHGVQIDHIRPYAEGGSNDLQNLRLLCGAHNRWRAACA